VTFNVISDAAFFKNATCRTTVHHAITAIDVRHNLRQCALDHTALYADDKTVEFRRVGGVID